MVKQQLATRESPRRIIRFGLFEADLNTGGLRKAGLRIKLQDQPFRVLALMLDRPGEIVSRAEIVHELWGDDTFVDFDQGVGAVIRKLRCALGDSATTPRYIETLRHKGYRFLMPCATESSVSDAANVPDVQGRRRWPLPMGVGFAIALTVLFVLWHVRPTKSAVYEKNVMFPKRQYAPRSMDAYLSYQKGRYLWRTRDATAVEKSIGYFQKAVDLEPNYALAHAGMADAYAILNFYKGQQRNTPMEKAKAAIRRALKADDSLAEAHTTQAYIKFYYEWDWAGAESAFRKAIALDPTYATARQWYAEYLFYMGRFEESQLEINRAHELDPQSVVISAQLASPYLYSRRYEEAIARIQDALSLNPEFALGIYMLGTCYEQLGRFDEALAEYRKIAGTKLGLTGLGYVYGRTGRLKEAYAVLRRLREGAERDNLSGYALAQVYAGLGETKQTLAWLRKAYSVRDERMVMLKVDPKLDKLRAEPNFSALLKSVGLT